MKIMDFLNKKAVTINLKAPDKVGAVKELVDLLVAADAIKGKDEMVKTLLAREALGSTGIGQGIGIPHGKSKNIKEGIEIAGKTIDIGKALKKFEELKKANNEKISFIHMMQVIYRTVLTGLS